MTSLRRRLVAITVGACVASFAVAGVVLYLSMRASLIREFDRALWARAETIAASTERSGEKLKVEVDDPGVGKPAKRSQRDLFQIWTPGGSELARSPDMQEQGLPFVALTGDIPAYNFITLPSGAIGRRVTLQFKPRPEDESPAAIAASAPVILAVAVDAHPLNRELARIAWQIATVFGAATIMAAAVMGAVVAVGLRPLGVLADRIAAHQDRGLTDRIELADAPAELKPVVARLNELLQRIATSFDREKAFTADVAHELRTPIGALETALDVCISRSRTPDEYRHVVGRCLQTVQQMHRLVEGLLLLGRAEGGQVQAELRDVDLRELLKDCWRPFDERARERQMRVEWIVPDAPQLHTDPNLLAIVLATLFDNAITHGDAGGWLSIEFLPGTLRLSNTGCTLAAENVAKVFDRFWQGDTARSSTGKHAGLGLSLCQKIMPLLNARAEARVLDGGIFQIDLIFQPNATIKAPDLTGATAA